MTGDVTDHLLLKVYYMEMLLFASPSFHATKRKDA